MILFDRRTFQAFDYMLLLDLALLMGLGILLVASAPVRGAGRRGR